jgi:hypothetical protein
MSKKKEDPNLRPELFFVFPFKLAIQVNSFK